MQTNSKQIYWILVFIFNVALAPCSQAGASDSEEKYEMVATGRMAAGHLAMGMIFLSQTVVGILGNLSLLYHYLLLYFTECRLRPTDLIIKHLLIANLLFLLFRGVPQTMVAFGFTHFPSDLGCKLVFYVHRVGRGVSVSTTCLLSVFQAITISPRGCKWAELKAKSHKCTGVSIFLCWILHILVNVMVPMRVTGNRSNRNITKPNDFGYCSADRDNNVRNLSIALLTFPDVLCLGLMPWASGFMVFILYRHRQRVQHIHGNKLSPRSSPESRATKTVLLLVSTFVSFYTLSLTFHVCLGLFSDPSQLMVDISAVTSAGFPAVSPFVLMIGDSNAFRLCFACIRTTACPSFLRSTCIV